MWCSVVLWYVNHQVRLEDLEMIPGDNLLLLHIAVEDTLALETVIMINGDEIVKYMVQMESGKPE